MRGPRGQGKTRIVMQIRIVARRNKAARTPADYENGPNDGCITIFAFSTKRAFYAISPRAGLRFRNPAQRLQL